MHIMRKIFVFGSNEAGRHGKGAAKYALENKGAIYGQGYGLQGDSYAIPTKDKNLKTLHVLTIRVYVEEFIEVARKGPPEILWEVTPIGCGLAGYNAYDIAPLFKTALDVPNIQLPQVFLDVLKSESVLP